MKRLVATMAALLVVVAVGAALVLYSLTIPVYTNPDAPWELSSELQGLPRDERFEAYYTRLPEYETAHKQLFGLGLNLAFLGIGAIATLGYLAIYRHVPLARNMAFVLMVWLSLWAVRVPLTGVMYRVRQMRGDYPTWGDTIIIPIINESLAWAVGAAVTSLALLILRIGYPVPQTIRIRRPGTVYGWLRAAVIMLWIILLLWVLLESFMYFDVGAVLVAMPAVTVLATMLAAHPSTREHEVGASDIPFNAATHS